MGFKRKRKEGSLEGRKEGEKGRSEEGTKNKKGTK